MPRSKVFRTIKQLADKYNFEFVGHTTKGHYKWRHRRSDRTFISVSNFTSFHALRNTEQTMRQVSNGQHRNEN